MRELVIASGNQHKIFEIKKLLNHFPVHIKALNEFPDIPDIIEDGLTFEANARKKAREIYNRLKLPVLADDSGLEVPALDNQPGVFSARFAGEDASDRNNIDLLLRRMAGLTGDKRKARFACTLCLIIDDKENIFNGYVEGIILNNVRGKSGFGYDPLFFVPNMNKTFAELETDEKSRISHRGRAMEKLHIFLNDYMRKA